MAAQTIALVICSTRSPRLNPFIVQHVERRIRPLLPISVALGTVDVAELALPLYDEPAIPSHLPTDDPTPHYAHKHTRRWSAVARQYDAFIFVTPQYNWSVPASLKNALDYLFHEWAAKPAAIVSYGGRGGGKSAAHLRDILHGLRMKPVEAAPALTTSGTTLTHCLESGSLGEVDVRRWAEAGVEEQLEAMTAELLQALSPNLRS
ncbi:hypothetical protein JDV02_004196 [Purpureocillium takamizusanense]|uniref:NADPH-dependent FMN reductase-like domain-containing protein n=1 Tax=Purpureocillium takamizusanense TaxID=2060973 RepID=A0A9Q8VAH8_9HYPO|nr:uncharacterized protein JDV02_004196 [Purpureocillium takamizusanense]UNI17884.1 hypothetical protein JDV02_004196 [Purpureocillium takamizusanense]